MGVIKGDTRSLDWLKSQRTLNQMSKFEALNPAC